MLTHGTETLTHPVGGAPAEAGPGSLSEAARRVRDGLGLPITAVPGIESENPAYVREHSRALNELIDGRPAPGGAWGVLERHLEGEGWETLSRREPPAFPGLWSRGEVPEIEGQGLAGVEREWRRRMKQHGRWAAVTATLHGEEDFAAVWRDILGGDFDLSGRGAEYTAGMEVFQASRWLGARTLLTLLGARAHEGIFLDVLGGDGYVWRLLQAERVAAGPPVALVRFDALDAGGVDAAALPEPLAGTVTGVHASAPDALVVAVGAPAADGSAAAVVLRRDGDRLAASAPMRLAGEELARLESLPGVGPYEGGLFRPAGTPGAAFVITNDVSPHMFARAGVWGFPTREDARRLSRTFRDASMDGVLFAYGTHHIDDMGASLREARRVVKPGGTVVVHDFLDEGPAGQWFHRIVDKRSKTGHDFPHIGPVQMAVHMLRAGLRDVRLHEIQDPFLFVSAPGEHRARELALGYIMGMYGLAVGFPNGVDELEEAIREILTYPEVGEVPVFAEDYVYIPRRAVVAVARRPAAGEDTGPTEGDRALADSLTRLFRSTPEELTASLDLPEEVRRHWFAPSGRWWNVSPAERRDWLDWASHL